MTELIILELSTLIGNRVSGTKVNVTATLNAIAFVLRVEMGVSG